MWTCSKCNTPEIDDSDAFCFCCGQQNEASSKPEIAATPVESSIKSITPSETVAPVSLSIQPIVRAASHLAYDASVLASQFPQWDLQPSAVMVRRVKRSI